MMLLLASVEVLALSDCENLLLAAWDGGIRVWELRAPAKAVVSLDCPEGMRPLAFSSDGHVVMWATTEGKSVVWNLDTNKHVQTFVGHNGHEWRGALSHDGEVGISIGTDSRLIVWRPQTGQRLATFTADDALSACAISSDGSRIIVGTDSGFVRLFSVEGLT
jgi:WD40 repeat protein